MLMGTFHTEVCNRLAPTTTENLVYIYSNLKAVAAAAHDDELKISHGIMNDAAICTAHCARCAAAAPPLTCTRHAAPRRNAGS